jgi:diguanylate cyclase (GGDEF)-like protein
VLVAFAHAIEGAIREQDVLGRYGGEEFLLLLPDCTEQQALACVERVRSAVAALEVPAEHGTIQITTSAGVALRQHGQEPADALLSRADAALYAAKAGGRDRVALG